MSLDKAIEHGKEKRKPYRGSKAFGHTCRNHGGCPWCEENRKERNGNRKMADERNTFIIIMNLFFDAKKEQEGE